MTKPPSSPNRNFALSIVRQLRDAGYEALWAGGCVRDQLLGRVPLDYDVATSATPDQVRRLFGRRRTVAVGAAFGVIIVTGGPGGAGQVEVATFRRDATYSDGRHPDSVTFSSPQEDARRRDFTINGLFFDPVAERVIDYVGGQEDLARKLIRAIGNPHERIAEDKLRLLRAARFAAKFDFTIDPATLQAVTENAAQIEQVSAERIAEEMRKMLVLPQRVRAVRLLLATGLLAAVLPESRSLGTVGPLTDPPDPEPTDELTENWLRVLAVLDRLPAPNFPQALAAILREIVSTPAGRRTLVETVCRRWRLSGEELASTAYLVENEPVLRRASRLPWPQLQRLLVTDGIDSLVELAEAVAGVVDGTSAEIDFCREKLQLPAEQLNPTPLISGDDLIARGFQPGKIFKTLLDSVRDAQLVGEVRTKAEALALAERLWHEQEAE